MPSLTEAQTNEIDQIWTQNAHELMFAVNDSLSWEAFTAGYAIAKGWL